MVTEEAQKTLTIDKSNWTPVKLGDVVREVRETVKDPAAEGLERIIGLEHIESESIHIKEWGQLSDGTTFTKVFRKGQVLFGRRRAYLKKAAIATFDGICSGDITVLEAKKDLLPELLPFLLQNDKFFDLAVQNSAGSLSPRAKFKDLANYEFLLPHKSQQSQIAELLWAADEVVEKLSTQKSRSEILFKSLVNKDIVQNIDNSVIEYQLDQLIDSIEAGTFVNASDEEVLPSNFGILKTSCVSSGIFLPNEVKKVVDEDIYKLKTSVKKNSIIISRINTFDLVGANVYVEKNYNNIYLPDRLWQTEISNTDVNVKYLWFILSSPTYRKIISELCSGTSNSMKYITKQNFLSIKVKVPSIEVQNKIVEIVEKIYNSNKKIELSLDVSKTLQKSLINQFF